jgi:hypothetical protein
VIHMRIFGTIYFQFARNCDDRDRLTITMLDIVMVPYRPRLTAFGRRSATVSAKKDRTSPASGSRPRLFAADTEPSSMTWNSGGRP